MLKLLFSIVTFPLTAFTLLKSTLTYNITVTELTWLIEYRGQGVTVRQTADNEEQLLAFLELISTAHALAYSIIFQASFIILLVFALIVFSIVKPRLIIHPVTLIFLFSGVVLLLYIHDQLAVLRLYGENLRYYFLLFTT